MKPFIKITVLSCLLAMFAFADTAMGQRWGRLAPAQRPPRGEWQWEEETPGPAGLPGFPGYWKWVLRWSNGQEEWWKKDDNGIWERISGPVGRETRIPRVQPTSPPPASHEQTPQAPPQTLQRPTPVYQPPATTSGTRGASINTSQRFQLVPGDVILIINGETMDREEDVTNAIARSPQTMYLTVRDGRTGQVAEYATTLNSNRPRFGMTHRTHPDGGSRVTGVNRNSPATRIYMVDSGVSHHPGSNRSSAAGETQWRPVNRLNRQMQTRIQNVIAGTIDSSSPATKNRAAANAIRSGNVQYRLNDGGAYQVTCDYGDFLLHPNGTVEWQ